MRQMRGRQPPHKPIGSRVIISCEGSKTERNYFEEIRQELRLGEDRIQVPRPRGTDPLTVVRTAIEARDVLPREDPWRPEDAAYAVFDGDEHFRKDPHNWNNAIQLARSRNIVLAISNPCIELWYLLHFQDQSAALNAKSAEARLRSYIPNYEHSSKVHMSYLRTRTPEAATRARQLAVWHEPSPTSCPPNPSTSVVELVELLLSLRRDR